MKAFVCSLILVFGFEAIMSPFFQIIQIFYFVKYWRKNTFIWQDFDIKLPPITIWRKFKNTWNCETWVKIWKNPFEAKNHRLVVVRDAKRWQMLQIYLCYFFQLVLIFGPFWVIFGLFGGNFRSFLGHFLELIFCGKILLCAI